VPESLNPLAEDLDMILSHTEHLWGDLRGQRLFITGGTGFFGTWLLESFCWANAKLGMGASVVVLSRNPDAFASKAPHLAANSAVTLHDGDVRNFKFPRGSFSHVIHAAASTSAALCQSGPLEILDTMIEGTRRTLDFALQAGVRSLMLTSSGAVYGSQPPDLTHVPETHKGAPDMMNPASAYGEGKRVAELLCCIYSKQHEIETKIARCFAFIGPNLPLSAQFAAGNFIGDAMQGRPIRVTGDGTPRRSYMYAADLVIWLWTILFRGDSCTPYNVGSESDLSIAEIAVAVSKVGPESPPVLILGEASHGPRGGYTPSTALARGSLRVRQLTPLAVAVSKTMMWNLTTGRERT
jgi:nucleoside-diphosphate-sugar epimerase